ncbi:MAG: protoglobin family protein [Gemmataceae bacterium]
MVATSERRSLKAIDERRLESDLEYRFGYVAEFMGFNRDDVAAIHAAAPLLAPVVTNLVDAVYDKLFSYDATKRHFVPRQSGYDGPAPVNLDDLTMDHDQTKFRKAHLARYLGRLVTAPYDATMVKYLDFVGQIHTPSAGSPQLDVPLVQMNALMGFVSDAVLATIFGLGLDAATTARTARAFSKLLWIQNDLITRHYAHGCSKSCEGGMR